MWRNHVWRNEKGSALFLTAIAMVVLLGFAALVTDVGLLYLNRYQLANAADAAALAGVQELPWSSWSAERRALAYGELNGVTGLTVQVSPNWQEITVEAAKDVQLFFARMLGFHSAEVKAKSKARVGPVQAIWGAVPLSVPQQEFVYGQQYALKVGAGMAEQGNFGALKLGPKGGASVFEDHVKRGYQGMLRIGDLVDTEPGNMAGPTARAIEYRIQQDQHRPACTWENYQPGCSRILIVPVVGPRSKPGRAQVEIVGFAAFFLDGPGEKGTVLGRFIEMAVDGEVGSGEDFGLRAYRLVE